MPKNSKKAIKTSKANENSRYFESIYKCSKAFDISPTLLVKILNGGVNVQDKPTIVGVKFEYCPEDELWHVAKQIKSPYHCDICNKTMGYYAHKIHDTSKSHIAKLSNKTEETQTTEKIDDTNHMPPICTSTPL